MEKWMEAQAIIRRLKDAGATITAEDGRLLYAPPSAVPADLLREIAEHEDELLSILQSQSPRLKYPEGSTGDELDEIQARLEQRGYALLWSEVLQDKVAYYKAESDRVRVPRGYVAYSLRELTELYARDTAIGVQKLKMIQEVKMRGGSVIASQEPG